MQSSSLSALALQGICWPRYEENDSSGTAKQHSQQDHTRVSALQVWALSDNARRGFLDKKSFGKVGQGSEKLYSLQSKILDISQSLKKPCNHTASFLHNGLQHGMPFLTFLRCNRQ